MVLKHLQKNYLCYRWLSMKQSMNVTGAIIWRPTTKFKRCNLTNLVYFKSFLRLHQNCMLSSSLGIIVVIAKRYYLMHPAMLVALYSMNGKYNNIIFMINGGGICVPSSSPATHNVVNSISGFCLTKSCCN